MKKLGLLMMLLLLSRIALFCQAQTAGIEEKEVLRNGKNVSLGALYSDYHNSDGSTI